MRPFEYIACTTLDEALGALSPDHGPKKILAGGTDLLIELRRPGRHAIPGIVDISRIGDLRGIVRVGEEIRVGALTTHAQLASDPLLAAAAPLLSAAARGIGSVQIRNRGTIGGNVMNAATCADTVPPLVALDARLTLASARGTRELPAGAFFQAPYRTAAASDEVLTSISFRALPPGSTSTFLKLGRRNAVAIARLSVAAILERDTAGTITRASVVPGSATPVWSRLQKVETLLAGRMPAPDLFSEAGRLAAEAMIRETGRRWSTDYKELVLAVLVRRALGVCCAPSDAERPLR